MTKILTQSGYNYEKNNYFEEIHKKLDEIKKVENINREKIEQI